MLLSEHRLSSGVHSSLLPIHANQDMDSNGTSVVDKI